MAGLYNANIRCPPLHRAFLATTSKPEHEYFSTWSLVCSLFDSLARYYYGDRTGKIFKYSKCPRAGWVSLTASGIRSRIVLVLTYSCTECHSSVIIVTDLPQIPLAIGVWKLHRFSYGQSWHLFLVSLWSWALPLSDGTLDRMSTSSQQKLVVHYFCHHECSTHIISHTRNTNACVTLDCMYVLCTSVGLSTDCLSGPSTKVISSNNAKATQMLEIADLAFNYPAHLITLYACTALAGIL